jgi:eukaryotic-like serine/threonine-protein kinase
LQHPNIVTVYDMGDERNTPYIAMDLIEGESLEQTVARHESVPLAIARGKAEMPLQVAG